MLTQDYILNQLRTVKSDLQVRYGISSLALFGSYSRTDATPESDVDIMVSFDKPIGLKFVHLADELEELLHNKVDLVSENGVKPKYMAFIKPDLIYV